MQEYAGMWKVAIRKLHRINKLTDSDLIEYHGNNVFMKDTLTNDERIVLMDVISLISNVDEFAKELIIEANLISSGKLPDNKKDFRSNWIGFIAECVHEASIDADEMDELIDEIDFTTDEYTSNELGSL